jgi:DNA-binding HxlR family transcriptional regulator
VLGNTYADQDCSIARSLEVIGERWTLLVLRDALYGVRRLTDFAQHLVMPRAVLADRLRKLVAHGVLDRVERHGAAVYELTGAGRDLWPVVHSLAHWGQQHATATQAPRAFTHAACGSQLDAHARCPTCEVVPDVGDVMTSRTRVVHSRSDRVSAVLAQPHRMLDPI